MIEGIDANFSPVMEEGRLLTPIHAPLREDLKRLLDISAVHSAATNEYFDTRKTVARDAASSIKFTFVYTEYRQNRYDYTYGNYDADLVETLGNYAKFQKTAVDPFDMTRALHGGDFPAWKKAVCENANHASKTYEKGKCAEPPDDTILQKAFDAAIEGIASSRAAYDQAGKALIQHNNLVLARLDAALEGRGYYRHVRPARRWKRLPRR